MVGLRAKATSDDGNQNFDLVYLPIAVLLKLFFASVRDAAALVQNRVIPHLPNEMLQVGPDLFEVVKCRTNEDSGARH